MLIGGIAGNRRSSAPQAERDPATGPGTPGLGSQTMPGDMPLTSYKYRYLRSCLPPPEAWLPHMQQAYREQWFSNFGPLSRQLERELQASYGAKGGVCVLACSATAGLAACLIAQGIQGAVLLPAFTFPASLSAVLMAGCRPVIVDVDRETSIVSPARLDQALQATKARAAMVVSAFGLKQSFDEHIRICRKHGAVLLIDNAAGLGLRREDAEQAPDVTEVCSMHATKPFAVGEGGVIFAGTAREENLRSALNFALSTYSRAEGPSWGINGKMPEISAAIGLAQLRSFDLQLQARHRFIEGYLAILGRFSGLSYVSDLDRSTWQSFPVLLPREDQAERLIAGAADLGLEIRRYYRPSLSIWPGVELAHPCPIAEDLGNRMCCLPVYCDASPPEREEMVAIVEAAMRRALS